MKVVEIFKNIQGEGIYSGCQTVFVRLAGCNLACEWCDTKYALQGKSKKYCHRDIIKEVESLNPPPMTIAFTGGEPMIYQKGLLRKTVKLLKIHGYEIHFETNGTIPPGGSLKRDVDFWSVSPKLQYDFGKIYPPSKVSYLESVKAFCTLESEKQLKFVIAKEEEVPLIFNLIEMMELPDEVVKSLPIVVQPERYTFTKVRGVSFGTERDLYLDGFDELIEWCEKHLRGLNWRVLPQLHYLLWKGERSK